MLAKSIPKINESPLSYMENQLIESIYSEPVTENEIDTLIKALNNTAAVFDNMNSMSFIDKVIICNWCFPLFFQKALILLTMIFC